MKIPDVTGFFLNNAKETLRNAGINHIKVIITEPAKPRNPENKKNFRVVRQKALNGSNIIELVVCNITP